MTSLYVKEILSLTIREYQITKLHIVKHVLVATSIQQAACIKQACIQIPQIGKYSKYIKIYLY